MPVTQRVRDILSNYESDNPGTKSNLARILSAGKLGGTGKMVILPVDQGFEHSPARSFAANPAAYDPHYHFKLAIEAGLSAYAAPLGMIEAAADSFAGAIPTILKLNSSNSLATTRRPPPRTRRSPAASATRCGWAVRRSASPSIPAANTPSTRWRSCASWPRRPSPPGWWW
jgi:class I fructose-bisphosphate aldolase